MTSYMDKQRQQIDLTGMGVGNNTNQVPSRKMGSSTCRLPVISIDAIQKTQESADSADMKLVLAWVDQIKFSRPKKHLLRDFSDGVMMAELIAQFLPKYVELHNYVPANAVPAKRDNWRTLNRRVFNKLEFAISDSLIEFIVLSKPGAIELVLKHVHARIMNILETKAKQMEENEAKQRSANGNDLGNGEGGYRELMCKVFGESPIDYVLCHGIKFVNEQVIEGTRTKVQEQEQEIKELRNKVRRLETLVNLKDERLCVLTMELHQAQQKNNSTGSVNAKKN